MSDDELKREKWHNEMRMDKRVQRETYKAGIAHDFVKLLAERNITIEELDDVFGYIKMIINTAPLSAVLSNSEINEEWRRMK